ncbi:MAG TPA: group II truncated hemoglobin [Polyangiaceae bacterium]|nr:group II truncated hemoglobin [Polyangiaceae bacterium]
MSGVPTLFEWLGGMPALERLTRTFYERVRDDAVLGPVFSRMSVDHPEHVAEFLAEVLGGPQIYSRERGGHPEMVRHHIGRSLSHVQRRRWIELLLECADAIGVPDDPEFRSAFVSYLEWGTRLAVLNSQPGAEVVPDAPMPSWGWGEVGGPWQPKP